MPWRYGCQTIGNPTRERGIATSATLLSRNGRTRPMADFGEIGLQGQFSEFAFLPSEVAV